MDKKFQFWVLWLILVPENETERLRPVLVGGKREVSPLPALLEVGAIHLFTNTPYGEIVQLSHRPCLCVVELRLKNEINNKHGCRQLAFLSRKAKERDAYIP